MKVKMFVDIFFYIRRKSWFVAGHIRDSKGGLEMELV